MGKHQAKRGTFINGIAASENLDSSGERIIIEGVDISSLAVDGIINWEHKNDTPNQIIGKILEAKKILKKEDCENDAHRYFWDKVKCPYIYIAAELFDHVGHGAAQDVAAMLKYDKNLDKEKTKALINFSIEGSTLKKEGSTIHKCIARKVTATIHPCNKMAFAEHMDEPKDKTKTMGDKKTAKEILDGFKKSEEIEIEVLKKAAGSYLTQLASVKGVKQPKSPSRDYTKIGPTTGEQKEGKPIKPKRTFSPTDSPDKLKLGDRIDHTGGKPKSRSGSSIYNDPDTWKKEKSALKKKKKLSKYDSNVRKALVAGSGMGAPGSKTGGSALQAESLDKQVEKTFKKKDKSSLYKRSDLMKSLSEDSWSRFQKKEDLIAIISNKSPDMPKKEVLAIAKTMSYILEKKAEMKLQGLNPNFDVKENFKTPGSGSANAKVPKEENQAKEPKESKEGLEKKDKIPGGLADKKKPSDFDQKALKQGIEVEMEHTSDKAVATEIAMDHLTEDPKYYDKLKSVEKKESVNLSSKHKSKKGGLTQAGRDKYNRETGSNLKAPVSAKQAKKSPKKAGRRKSFCARMSGNKGELYEYKDTDRDGDKEKVPTRKKKALDRWDC